MRIVYDTPESWGKPAHRWGGTATEEANVL
jgi:hypothetical protein